MSEYIIDWDENLVIDTFSKNSLRDEIVRCRDCTYYDKYPNDEISVCYRFDNEQPIVEPDGFCKWGERRAYERVHR